MGKELENIDLTIVQRKEIVSLLKRYLPDTEVWAYGSRAKFTAKPSSDLDMVAFVTPDQKMTIYNLKEAFEESSLPFRVDLFVWDEVPEQFHKNIENDRTVLQKKTIDNELPEGWEEVRLEQVVSIHDCSRIPIKKSDRKFGCYPYYGASGITDYIDNYIFDGNYILLAEDGDNLRTQNTPIVFMARGKFWVNNHAHVCKAKNSNITEYICYALQVADISQYISGSTRPKITQSDMRKIIFNLPPLPEQRDIAHILGSLDNKIELNRKMNETLEAMAQALFKSWFVDFDPVIDNALAAGNEIPEDLKEKAEIREALGDVRKPLPKEIQNLFPSEFEHSAEMGWIPKGWRVSTVGESLTPKKGKSVTKKTIVEGEVPVIAGGKQPAYYHNAANVSAPVISISASGANAGFVNLHLKDIWASDCSYISKDQTKYVYSYYIMLKIKQKDIYHMQQGAAQPHIYPSDIMRLNYAKPSIVIFEYYEKKMENLYARVSQNRLQSIHLSNLRDTLLPKLLSGEARVLEAEKLVGNLNRKGDRNGR